jgi:hypothetical protein
MDVLRDSHVYKALVFQQQPRRPLHPTPVNVRTMDNAILRATLVVVKKLTVDQYVTPLMIAVWSPVKLITQHLAKVK